MGDKTGSRDIAQPYKISLIGSVWAALGDAMSMRWCGVGKEAAVAAVPLPYPTQ